MPGRGHSPRNARAGVSLTRSRASERPVKVSGMNRGGRCRGRWLARVGPVDHCGRVSVSVWVSGHREPWLRPREELRGQPGGAWAVQGELPSPLWEGLASGIGLTGPSWLDSQALSSPGAEAGPGSLRKAFRGHPVSPCLHPQAATPEENVLERPLPPWPSGMCFLSAWIFLNYSQV